MSFKLNRSQKDHLYWFFPFLFLGLAFIAISQGKNAREATAQNDANVKSDSSLTISTKSVIVDSLNAQTFDDGTAIPMTY
jgi:hypothetical protein